MIEFSAMLEENAWVARLLATLWSTIGMFFGLNCSILPLFETNT